LIDFDLLLDVAPSVGQRARMPSWSDFEAAAPELAARVRERLDAHTHKTIATIRRDGSPRISGIESRFEAGELLIGSMWHGVKALDLLRDPRFALHSGSDDPSAWKGDAKLAGVVADITDPNQEGERAHTFQLDLREVSTVRLDDARTHLIIDVWTPDEGVRTIKRK
jgi:hypothetical protein